MTDKECIALAEQYLSSNDIGYLVPGKVVRTGEHTVQVVFPVPGTEDPAIAVVDPPDVRVHLNIRDRTADLVYQM
jgi:hypothetical protein